jgi:hypothetical protein
MMIYDAFLSSCHLPKNSSAKVFKIQLYNYQREVQYYQSWVQYMVFLSKKETISTEVVANISYC